MPVTERLPKGVLISAAILGLLILAYAALSRPWYFTSQSYLGGLMLFEFLIAAVWMYRRVFFPVVVVAFLFAGVDLPVGTAVWTAARWVFLAVGASVGFFIVLKDRGYRFGLFHALAFFTVLTALVSAAVSRYPDVALLKVLSLFLLFLYASTGPRIAAAGREHRFFAGLLLGCEIFVGANAVLYAAGIEAMGNPNSLGAVMGVACAPLLLWGILLGGEHFAQLRRWVLFAACMYMAVVSHARAGLGAALISCGLLCLALRKYKLAVEGSIIVVILVALGAIFQPEAVTSLASSVVYKGGDATNGMLASRESPWHAAVESIRERPWFGTGFGTTATGTESDEPEHGRFSSSWHVTRENGSSYLAILAGVGVLGVLPFLLLLILVLGKVVRTISWMRVSGNPAHPAVPLAIVMVAGLAHAAFEDWLFAPGYYLCVFFWCLAFVLIDVAPSAQVSKLASRWARQPSQHAVGSVVPGR